MVAEKQGIIPLNIFKKTSNDNAYQGNSQYDKIRFGGELVYKQPIKPGSLAKIDQPVYHHKGYGQQHKFPQIANHMIHKRQVDSGKVMSQPGHGGK
jgi:hypothetical protein